MRRGSLPSTVAGMAAAALVTASSCVGGGDVVGRVLVSGSSTVEPISTRVAELFEDVRPELLVDVDGPGTGDGLRLFCGGEAEVAGASRPIRPSEVAACEAAGIGFVELAVAYDGVTVVTHPDRAGVGCLALVDLYALVGPESAEVEDWRDARALAGALGSDTAFPDAPFSLIAPGQESGTYDAFVELALAPIVEERFAAGHLAPAPGDPDAPAAFIREFPDQSDDHVILSGVAGSPSALGWVGFAFAEQAGDSVHRMALDGGAGCVEPDAATIAEGTYPLARTLYLYVSTGALADTPLLAAYVDHFLSDAGQAAVAEVGYVPLDARRLAEERAAWAARRTGSQAALDG